MTANNNKTFLRITNEDIYIEIKSLRTDFNRVKTRVKINTWCSVTALSVCLGALIGLLIK
jgi:hypothetical protein